MSALILLSEFRMKKNALKESQTPVDMKFMREFRAEMNSRFSAHDEKFKEHDARFEQIAGKFAQNESRFDEIDARFAQIDARFDQVDARFAQIDARFEQVDARFAQIDARFDELDAKIDRGVAEIKAMFHQSMLIFEEQNLRNKQSSDGYVLVYEALQDLRQKMGLN